MAENCTIWRCIYIYIYIWYIYISPFDGDFYRYVTQKVRWLEFFGRKVVAPSWASLPSIPGKSSQHSWCFSIKNGCLRKKGDHSQRALLIHRSTTSFLLCVRKVFPNFQIFLDDVKISLGFVNFWIAFVMPELSDEYPMLLIKGFTGVSRRSEFYVERSCVWKRSFWMEEKSWNSSKPKLLGRNYWILLTFVLVTWFGGKQLFYCVHPHPWSLVDSYESIL